MISITTELAQGTMYAQSRDTKLEVSEKEA